MIASIMIGAVVFGYAGWAFVRFINKSKKGKCAACAVQKKCSSSCEIPTKKVL